MTLPQGERKLLARIGFFLCREGQIPEAENIFTALSLSEPDKDGPAAGCALCCIIKGDFDGALERLEKHLAKGKLCAIPEQLSIYKLLALGMAGRLDEAKALRARMEQDGMALAFKTTDLLLREMEKKP